MERVGILINKLQEQLVQKADWKNMLLTTQMLQAELMQNAQRSNGHSLSKVSVVLPFTTPLMNIAVDVPETIHAAAEAKNIELNNEASNSAVKELAEQPTTPEIAKPAAAAVQQPPAFIAEDSDKFSKSAPSGWLFNPVEVPTLAHQDKGIYEINDTLLSTAGSLNEMLKEEKSEVAHTLQGSPIKDLKKAISINDRHRFIHDLFRDDETMYERSIKTINSFAIFPEAEYWIQRELKLKHGWDINNETVKIFDQLVKRRFS